MQEVDNNAALPEHSSKVHHALQELMQAASADAGEAIRLVQLWVASITACSKSQPPSEGEVPREILAAKTQANAKCAKLRGRLAAAGGIMMGSMPGDARAALKAEADVAEVQREEARAAYKEAKANVAGRFHQELSDWQSVRPPENGSFDMPLLFVGVWPASPGDGAKGTCGLPVCLIIRLRVD